MSATIVGVLKDFHDKSFHEDINALCITTYTDQYENYAVKINLENIATAMGFCMGYFNDRRSSSCYSWIPECAGGIDEPGEEFEDGVIYNLYFPSQKTLTFAP